MAENTNRGCCSDNQTEQRDYETKTAVADCEKETDEYTPAQIQEAVRAADDPRNQTPGRTQGTRRRQ
jgi:hypothetical protein